ncbi:MAG: hypothetical protein L0Y71_12680 [Gemmataceae bacterium]|nr:hypothetical protein [Gemmataceae bacterium]
MRVLDHLQFGVLVAGAALMGHFLATPTFAIPDHKECPMTPNATCPTCQEVPAGEIKVWCKMAADTYPVCKFKTDEYCRDDTEIACVGFVNSMANCNGVDDPNLDCGVKRFRCFVVKLP